MVGQPTVTTNDTDALRDALEALAVGAGEVRFALPGPHREHRTDLAHEVASRIRDYLLPRLADLDAPAVVVLVGATGAGKSTLLNTLAGEVVTQPGALRPTTRTPVVWTHADHTERYGRDFLPRFTGADRRLQVVGHHDDDLSGVTVVDTPDLDSVEVANREIADEVLAAADLCVFVTSAQRYADAVPWDVLRGTRERGLPLVVVCNRLPATGATEILDDLHRRLSEEGVIERDGPLELIAIDEQGPLGPDGLLHPDDAAPLRDRLASLADAEQRAALVAEALGSGIDHVLALTDVLAETVRDERGEADGLLAAVDGAYAAQRDDLLASLDQGRLIHAEVLARWQAFVGTGELLRVLNEGASRLRGWVRRVLGGGPQPQTEQVRGEARATLVDAVTRRAERAAATAAGAWELSPAGEALLDRGLWHADTETEARARRAVEDWLAELADLVAAQGADRRRLAQVTSTGVNVVAVALMLTVFAHTGGLSGAEVGITAGAAAVQQRLLEHVVGSAAARSLVARGRQRLEEVLGDVLAADRQRFDAILAPLVPAAGAEAHLAELARAVAATRIRALPEATHG